MRWNELRMFHEPVPSTQSTLIYATSQPKPRSRTPFWENNKGCGQFSGERWWGKLFAGRTRGHQGRSEIQHGMILITNATSPCVVSQPLGKTGRNVVPVYCEEISVAYGVSGSPDRNGRGRPSSREDRELRFPHFLPIRRSNGESEEKWTGMILGKMRRDSGGARIGHRNGVLERPTMWRDSAAGPADLRYKDIAGLNGFGQFRVAFRLHSVYINRVVFLELKGGASY